MNPFVRFINNFVDFFFPHICLVCGNKITLNYNLEKADKTQLVSNKRIVSTEFCCDICKSQIVYAPNKEEVLAGIIPFHSKEEISISNAVSLFENTENPPTINLIYKLKYFGFTRVGIEYGKWLGEKIIAENLGEDYNYITPVPIHKAKKRQRGYNQSDYIATGINEVLQKTLATDLLKRTKHTQSQTALNIEERMQNVKAVFEVNPKYDVSGKNILLVDDVLTTGSTLNNCAQALLYSKARRVDIATLLKPHNTSY